MSSGLHLPHKLPIGFYDPRLVDDVAVTASVGSPARQLGRFLVCLNDTVMVNDSTCIGIHVK